MPRNIDSNNKTMLNTKLIVRSLTDGGPMRKEYIQNQKSVHGRKVLAVLPIFYPKEILTAMNILAVEVWGPPGNPKSTDAGRIQTYVCPIVRNALGFVAAGGINETDGILFPHTCDSIQGLASVLPDFGPLQKPAFNFIHPKGGIRKSTQKYVRKEMESLADKLEGLVCFSLDSSKLSWAIGLHRKIDALKLKLMDKRSFLPISDFEFFSLIRRGEFLWPEDHLLELKIGRAHV